MRIEQDGELTVALAAPLDDVLAVLHDLDEVASFVAPLLDRRSTHDRWVVEPVRIGPVTVRPVTHVRLEREATTVAVRGVPVPDTTPTWLDVVMVGHDLGQRSRLDVTWRVRVELRGPQLVARLARPLLEAEARHVTEDLSTRLVARFADRAPGAAADATREHHGPPSTT